MLCSVLCMCGMLSFSFPRVFGLVIVVIIITFFIVLLRLLLLLSSLENDRSRNSSASGSCTYCRQQKTTFPYTSIELAGWLAGWLTEWLCSGQRLNVTAIKTKWHWNTHKNFNQLFMQNNRCLNRFKLIKKSEGGFGTHTHAQTKPSRLQICGKVCHSDEICH